MLDLKQITSAQKITLITDVNIITNVFFILKYESVLTKVTTLVSLNKTLPSSGPTDSYVRYIRNQTDMLPVDS